MEKGQAGVLATEIIISSEMVAAGASVLRFAGANLFDGGAETAEDVLVAMLQASDAFQRGELMIRPSWQTP